MSRHGPHRLAGYICWSGVLGETMEAGGADLVAEVSRLTGYPDPAAWSGDSLARRVRERQRGAHLVVVVTGPDGDVVGHSLLAPALDDHWGTYPLTATAWRQGRLAESGASAVRPDQHGLGIASWMRRVRAAHAAERNLMVVAATWDGGPSEVMYAGRPDWIEVGRRTAPVAGHPVTLWASTGGAVAG